MKERPILFSAPMVRAILEGRKTMTRRVIRQQPSAGVRWGFDGWEDGRGKALRCPYGQPGDRLWVKETWQVFMPTLRNIVPFKGSMKIQPVICLTGFAATEEQRARDYGGEAYRGPWRPSIFMPRWASRITLEITAVQVERVQDISEADSKDEGVTLIEGNPLRHDGLDYSSEFTGLWDSINAKRGYGWHANPWVWVIEFKRIEP